MKINKFVARSLVDGPGERTTVYLQGCPINCPGCHSPARHPADAGHEMPVDEVAARLLDVQLPVTISGGEPLLQSAAVADLVVMLHLQKPGLHIIVYTGLTYDDIMAIAPALPGLWTIMKQVDVLVDGPYVIGEDNDYMQWRGSENQRPIDPGTLEILDWSRQCFTIGEAGELSGTAGAVRAVFGSGWELARMCGEA